MPETEADEELFGEAAAEMRTDVERHLDAVWDALPTPEEIWQVESDNTLGVLNALRSALATEEGREHLRDAKKWYAVGERADAFEDADELEAAIEAAEAVLDDVEAAYEQVGELTTTIPRLRSALEDAREDGGEDDDEE